MNSSSISSLSTYSRFLAPYKFALYKVVKDLSYPESFIKLGNLLTYFLLFNPLFDINNLN